MKKDRRFFGILSSWWKGFCNCYSKVLSWFGLGSGGLMSRICRGTVALSIAALALMTAVIGACEFYRYWLLDKVVYPYMVDRVYHSLPLSNAIHFQDLSCRETGRVYNTLTGEVLLEEVDWVVLAPDKDSLVVFCRFGKRGYLNRFTGKVAVQPLYDKAWVFSDGLAAVVRQGRMTFIDKTGRTVIDKGLEPCRWGADMVFRDGHCKVFDPLTEKVGLIDRQGEFVLDTVYDDMKFEDGYWLLDKGECMGLFHPAKGMVYPPVHLDILIYKDYISVLGEDRITRLYDHDGNTVADMVISSVQPLRYMTDQVVYDEDECDMTQVTAVAECRVYAAGANSHYEMVGLMDRLGNCITRPVYTEITAIARNRYLCQPHGHILDSAGKVIENKPELDL